MTRFGLSTCRLGRRGVAVGFANWARAEFLRDVSVQVTGNLITAAVLYLAGAATGLLPTTFVATTVAGLLLYLAFLFFIATRFFRDQRRFVVSGAGLVAGGLAMLILAVADAVPAGGSRIVFWLLGISAPVSGAITAAVSWNAHCAESRPRSDRVLQPR